MLQIRSLKSAYLIPLIILAISTILVVLFPNKPPKILDISLFDSPINPKISVTFSEPIDKLSLIDGGFLTTPRINGDFSWSGNTLFFTPKENLEFNTIYQLQINSTVKSQEGEYLQETFDYKVKTQPRRLVYLSPSGQISSYNFSNKQSTAITGGKLQILDFDYDSTTGQLIALALENTDKIPALFLIDAETGKSRKLKKISTSNYKINHVKWLPFENSLLVSRTKIQFVNNDGSIATTSQHAKDTELIKYDLESKKVTPFITGNALIYEPYPSPDGFKVGYVNDQGAFVLRDINSGSETVIASQFYDYFGLSDFGNYAIYLTTDDFSVYTLQSNIVLQDTEGEKTTISVDEIDSKVIDPTISPDEKTLAFVVANEFGDHQLAKADIESGVVKFLSEDLNKMGQLEFSPDGKLLAFIVEDYEKVSYIKIYNLETEEFVDLERSASKLEWVY